jgi:acetolactate synthase I/III small subunit
MSKHTISILVENNSGALSRIAGLFASRGYNIKSLSVSETDDDTMSRMTIVSEGDDEIMEQINKQLNRLIDVIKVLDFVEGESVERELMLITLASTNNNRHEVVGIADIFDGKVVGVSVGEITIEVSGRGDQLDDFTNMVRPYGIKEIARSGPIALARAKK